MRQSALAYSKGGGGSAGTTDCSFNDKGGGGGGGAGSSFVGGVSEGTTVNGIRVGNGEITICIAQAPTETPTDTPSATPTQTATPTATQSATPTVTPTATSVPQGGACTDASQCTTGLFCSDNVCCDTICAGGGQSCAVPGQEGTCVTAPAGVPAASSTGLFAMLGALIAAAFVALRVRRRA